MEKIIEIKNITKRFKQYIVLNEVTVSFEKARIYGIIGRNGSGKTVLLKCICGIMHQDSGEIIVHGKRIGKDIDMAQGIGAIIENPDFLPNYSGMNNLKMLMGISQKADKERIGKCMLDVGLDPKEKKHVGKYSLGMRQRLGIAQAILENPDILILDEPMNGLDNNGAAHMRHLFLEMKNQEKTILLASHNQDDIEMLCDEVYQIEESKIKKIG